MDAAASPEPILGKGHSMAPVTIHWPQEDESLLVPSVIIGRVELDR